MNNSNSGNVTQVLEAAVDGDEHAAQRLFPLVYDELRGLARARIAKHPPGTMQATALVHEAYLRIAGKHDAQWAGRTHFFRAAARALRDILVENARRKASLKRGGDRRRVGLEEVAFSTGMEQDVVAINTALEKLEQLDPVKANIAVLRYFCGLTVRETTDTLGLSLTAVERKWRLTRAWLRRELDPTNHDTE